MPYIMSYLSYEFSDCNTFSLKTIEPLLLISSNLQLVLIWFEFAIYVRSFFRLEKEDNDGTAQQIYGNGTIFWENSALD